MPRHLNFGIGVTLFIVGLTIGYGIHQIDPGDNTPIAIAGIGPGATLIGKAIWPPR